MAGGTALSFCLLMLAAGAKSHPGGRIVGGEDAELSDYPWQVSLRNIVLGLSHFCGGSIIDDVWVLTAAHCVDGIGPLFVQVVAGQDNIHVPESEEQIHFVSRLFVHPEYVYTSFEHDIALVKLTSPLVYGEKIGPIDLASFDVAEGTYCDATGWGTLSSDALLLSSTLQKVSVPVVDDDTCGRAYPTDMIPPEMVCAGEEGKDTCSGDSGGPLACPNPETGALELSGVTSFGIGCGEPGFPGVYTDVPFYSDWIAQTIQDNSD